MYWIKSFVPIEKKSTSLANSSAITAAAGISTIIPHWILSEYSFPSVLSSALHSSTTSLAWRNSCIPEIIGNITQSLPNTDALSNALNCTLNISFLSKQSLIALYPKNGFISWGNGK